MQTSLTHILIFFGFVFVLFSCDSTTESSNASSKDSLEVEIIDNEAAAVAPNLIGRWQLKEIRMGNTPMSMEDFGVSTIEFTADGNMISRAPDLPAETFPFELDNDVISSEGQDGDQRIEEVTDSRLVLVSTIDGTDIKYIYDRFEGE